MSVRKRRWTTRNGEARETWIVDYFDRAGERHIKSFDRKKDAGDFRDSVGVDVRAGTHTPDSKSITVDQAAEDWIKAVTSNDREASTIAQYRQHAKHISDRIGKVKLSALTAPRVNVFRDDLLATVSRAMARKVLSSLKSLLRDAQRRGNVAQNVALAVKIDTPKRRKHKLTIGTDIPSAAEIKLIIGALPDFWRPVILTLIFTGLRSSELRGLRWEDLDLKRGELHVRQRADRYNAIGKPKSESGNRTIPLGPLVLNVLREWRLKCPRGADGLVFPTSTGRIARHNNTVRAFKRVVLAAGLKRGDRPKYTGLHALRHFYASWLINPVERGGQGLPPKVVQELLGHSTIAMTMDRYGHLFPRAGDVDAKLVAAERALLG